MSPHERSKHRKRSHKSPKDNRRSRLFPNSKYASKSTRKRGDKLQKEVARMLRKVDHPMFKSTFRIIQLHIFFITGLQFPLDELFNERKMLDILPDDINLDRWIYLKTAKKDLLASLMMNIAMMKQLSEWKLSNARTHEIPLSTVIQQLWESSNSSNYDSSDHQSSPSSRHADSLPHQTNQVGYLKPDISRSTTHDGLDSSNSKMGSSFQIGKQRVYQQYAYSDVLPVRHSTDANALGLYWPTEGPVSPPLLDDDDDENPDHKLSLAERCKKLLGSLN